MKSRAWNKYNAAVRLRRDAEMTVAFLAAHGLKDRPTRKGAELQAAEDYYRWCLTDGPEALDALDGAAVESFVDQWRLHAVAADVRAAQKICLALGSKVRVQSIRESQPQVYTSP